MPGKKRAVVKVHKRDRKVVQRYPSLIEAAKAEGVTDATVRGKIIHRRLQSGDCYLRYEDEFDPNEDFTGRKNCPVIIYEPGKPRYWWFGTIRLAAEALNLSYSTVMSAITDGYLLLGRYVVKHYGRRLP